MNKYNCIIFDLDGTLLNTIHDISDSVNSVLNSLDLPTHSENTYKILVGGGIKNLVFNALPENKRQSKFVEYTLQLVRKKYEQNFDTKTHIYHGIDSLLDYLELNKFKISILSNKPHNLTIRTYEKFLSKWHFTSIYGDIDNIPVKPNPFQAINIAKEMKSLPQNIMFLGDSDIDMITAKNSGMFAAGALWGFRNKEELLKNGADILFNNPIEIVNFLKINK